MLEARDGMFVVLYQWRWIADRLKLALIVRQFAAEYALLQASGSLLRYRFYANAISQSSTSSFLFAGNSRICFSAYYIALYSCSFPRREIALSLSLSLPLFFSRVVSTGTPCPGSVCDTRHWRDVAVPAMMSGSILWAQCESMTAMPVSHYRADEKIGPEFS